MTNDDLVPPVRFRDLTFPQAQRHLDAYLVGMPARIAALRADVPDRRGPSATELDGSPDSLDRLWAWYRSAEKPVGPSWTAADQDLPIWAPHLPAGRHRGWSVALLHDLDRISGYAGHVIVAADDTAEWAVKVLPKGAKGGTWIGLHEPVIVSRRVGPRNPRHQIGVLINRLLKPSTDSAHVRQRLRLLLPTGVPDDPPVRDPVEQEESVDTLVVEAGASDEELFDVRVWVDETTEIVAGSDAYGGLEARVGAADGIDRAAHVDREVLYLNTELPYHEVERIVRDALRTEPTT